MHPSDRGTHGEFNWSSQHIDEEVLRCRNGNGNGQTEQVGLRCGRPRVAGRAEQQRFWKAIARGLLSEDAAVSCGVSPPVGGRWFREGGGVTPISLAPRSARSLSFAEREEIAILRAQGAGVRDIARRLRRAPSTVSRELRRNAATQSGGLEYRASTAQWHSGIAPSVGTQGDAFDNALAESVIRALQDGGDSTTRPMADARGRGVRHIGVGGLVQHAAVAGADWRRAPGGVRSAIL